MRKQIGSWNRSYTKNNLLLFDKGGIEKMSYSQIGSQLKK